MSQMSNNRPVKSSLRAAFVAALALLYAPDTPGPLPRVGWAQEVRQGSAKPHRPPQDMTSVPAAVTLPAKDPTGGTLGSTLGSCDKEAQNSEGLILPGAKGDFKLDRCYRGRDHLVCSFNALLKEARSLLGDSRKLVEARYPEVSNVTDVCKIKSANLAADMQSAMDFANRFKVLKAEYGTRIACANKIGETFKDVTLPEIAQAPELLKSMIDVVDADVRSVSVEEAKVVELSQKIDTSQKAMITIQKLHRLICTQDQHPASTEERANR